jgi:hypothetical protein
MKRVAAVSLAFIAGVAADRLFVERPVLAQASKPATDSSSLAIGNASIAIGMSKEKALASLSAYNVAFLRDDQATVTTRPAQRDGASYLRFLGDISFENGTVTQITRNRDQRESGPEIQRLWRSLWGAIATTIPDSERYTPVSIRAYSTTSPQSQWKKIDLLLRSNRVVSIGWADVDTAGIVISPKVSSISSVGVEETVF